MNLLSRRSIPILTVVVALVIAAVLADPLLRDTTSATDEPIDTVEERIRPVGRVAIAAPATPNPEEPPEVDIVSVSGSEEATVTDTPPAVESDGQIPVSNTLSEASETAASEISQAPASSPYDQENGSKVYAQACQSCHETGKDEAPRLGDKAAWTPRFAKGISALVRSSIKGIGKMPAKGGTAKLNESDINDAVWHLLETTFWPAQKGQVQ